MLNINNVTVKFGGLTAVDDMSLNVKKGTIHALIGPNGAGKTTLFNVITGIIKPYSGDIIYKDKSILNDKPEKIIYKGISRTFQNLQLFNFLNVYENIYSGYVHKSNTNIFNPSNIFNKKFEKEAKEKIFEVAELLNIKNRLYSYPSQLSYGLLKRVELARALVSDPEILLFDEPAAGLNHNETSEIISILKMLRYKGKTIFLVEHDMNLVMNVSQIITVMSFGQKIAEDTPEKIANNKTVIEVYLGESENVGS